MGLPPLPPEWASDDNYSTGDFAGSPTKVLPDNFPEGEHPGDQLPGEFYNYLHNVWSKLTQWCLGLQLQNWFEAGEIGEPADGANFELRGAYRTYQGRAVLVCTAPSASYRFYVGGDAGNLSAAPGVVGAPVVFNRNLSGGLPANWVPGNRNGAMKDDGTLLITCGQNSDNADQPLVMLDFTADPAGSVVNAGETLANFAVAMGTQSVAYDPSRAEWYVYGEHSGGNHHVWMSDDDGATWTDQGEVSADGASGGIATDGNGTLLHVEGSAPDSTARISLDGGTSWTDGKTWSNSNNEATLSTSPVWSPYWKRFYVVKRDGTVTDDPAQLWQSADGVSWSVVCTFNENDFVNDLFDQLNELWVDGAALVIVNNGTTNNPSEEWPSILISTDGGVSWRRITITEAHTNFDSIAARGFHFDGRAYWCYRQGDGSNLSMLMKTLSASLPPAETPIVP